MSPKNKAKKTVGMLGYGSQGRAIALNLRDSGFSVRLGLRAKSKSAVIAKRDGFKAIGSVSEAASESDILIFALPDHQHGRVYEKEIKANLKASATLVFLHGTSIHFGFVVPPQKSDVILIAPHAPGMAVREKYLTDKSISAFYAVHQNYSGKAAKTVIELAGAMGFVKSRLIKTTFVTEAVGDLFGEQAVLCGGLALLVKNGFEVLVEAGIKADHAYLEVAYQLDLIIALIKRYGIEGMFKRISVAARYGSYVNGPWIIDKSIKKKMQAVYSEIASGEFPNKLYSLSEKEISALDKKLKEMTHPAFERAAKKFAPKP